jgi:hypothetical protein
MSYSVVPSRGARASLAAPRLIGATCACRAAAGERARDDRGAET